MTWDGLQRHECEEFSNSYQYLTYGPAITQIVYIPPGYFDRNACEFAGEVAQTGIWIADNNEYDTSIKFCPFCGIKLPIPAEVK